MILDEPYNTWLIQKVAQNLEPDSRYVLQITATTMQGEVPVDVDFDLTWFILIHVQDDDKTKLDVALALLKQAKYLERFKATMTKQNAKRIIAEFLIFNTVFLEGLKQYLDFSVLNSPIDFISHALLIKLSDTVDTNQQEEYRAKIVTLVLSTDFKILQDIPAQSLGAAVRKLLFMESIPNRFSLAKQMLELGYKLFSDNPKSNSEIAVLLINNRTIPECQDMLMRCLEELKHINLPVAGSNSGGNLADYYYWVKEDLAAVKYISEQLGIIKSN
jgi:hypothetical protein